MINTNGVIPKKVHAGTIVGATNVCILGLSMHDQAPASSLRELDEMANHPDFVAASGLLNAIRRLPQYPNIPGERLIGRLSGAKRPGEIVDPTVLPTGVAIHLVPEASQPALPEPVEYRWEARADSPDRGLLDLPPDIEVADIHFAQVVGGDEDSTTRAYRNVDYYVLRGGPGTPFADRPPLFVDKLVTSYIIPSEGAIVDSNPEAEAQHAAARESGVTTPLPEEVSEVVAFINGYLEQTGQNGDPAVAA